MVVGVGWVCVVRTGYVEAGRDAMEYFATSNKSLHLRELRARLSPFGLRALKIQQRGGQWKQGVVILDHRLDSFIT